MQLVFPLHTGPGSITCILPQTRLEGDLGRDKCYFPYPKPGNHTTPAITQAHKAASAVQICRFDCSALLPRPAFCPGEWTVVPAWLGRDDQLKRRGENEVKRSTYTLVSSECPSLYLLAACVRMESLWKELFLLSLPKSWSSPPSNGQNTVCW